MVHTFCFAGHRIRTVHAFGMVVLEILGTKIEDSGTYTCCATNKWGKAEISVTLECIDKSKGQKPKFTTQIKVTVYDLNISIYFIFICMTLVIEHPAYIICNLL